MGPKLKEIALWTNSRVTELAGLTLVILKTFHFSGLLKLFTKSKTSTDIKKKGWKLLNLPKRQIKLKRVKRNHPNEPPNRKFKMCEMWVIFSVCLVGLPCWGFSYFCDQYNQICFHDLFWGFTVSILPTLPTFGVSVSYGIQNLFSELLGPIKTIFSPLGGLLSVFGLHYKCLGFQLVMGSQLVFSAFEGNQIYFYTVLGKW